MNRNNLKRATLFIGLGFIYLALKELSFLPFKSPSFVEGLLFGFGCGGLVLLVHEVFFAQNHEETYNE